MKKLIGLCLLLAVVLSLCIIPACATDGPIDILSSEEMAFINSTFPREIQYIEMQKAIDLESLTDMELELLKEAVGPQLYNPDYNFLELMSVLTDALAQKEREDSSKARWTQEVIIADYCVRQYGPIKGKYLQAVAAASTHTDSFSLTIEAGYEKDDFVINASFTCQGEYSVSGPSMNDVLPNGATVTHHVAIGVLSGEIWYKEYDLVTAFTTTRVKMYYIKEETAINEAYTFPAHLATPTFARSAVSQTEWAQFANQNELIDAVINTPERFVVVGAMN